MGETTVKADLATRTKQFALRVLRVCGTLPTRGPGDVIARQLARSGMSVGAQYREAHRARSTAEFISKLESAMQELEESIYWFELLVEGGFVSVGKLSALAQEADELMAIFVASVRTAKRRGPK